MTNRWLGHEHERVRLVRLVVFTVAALAVLLRATAAFAEDGLPPGVPVPSWAVGDRIHFDPVPTPTSPSPTSGGVGAGEKPLAPELKEIKYWGGLVQTTPRVALIFWGKNWENEPGKALRQQLVSLFRTTPGSGYQKLLSQYDDRFGTIATEGPELYLNTVDTHVPIATNVSYRAIKEEAEAYGGGYGSLPVTYMVLPAPGSTYKEGFDENFCAYHEAFGVVGGDEALAFVPYEEILPSVEGRTPAKITQQKAPNPKTTPTSPHPRPRLTSTPRASPIQNRLKAG